MGHPVHLAATWVQRQTAWSIQSRGDEVFHPAPVQVRPPDLVRQPVRPVHLASARVQRQSACRRVQSWGDEVFHSAPVQVRPLDLDSPLGRPVHLAGAQVQRQSARRDQSRDELFHPAPVQVRPLDPFRHRVRPVHLAAARVRDRDHGHCRERTCPPAAPQPHRGERSAVHGPQEQKPPKVSEEFVTEPLEPFRNGSNLLLEIPPGEDFLQRVPPRLVADVKLDPGARLRLENGQSGTDIGRVLDEQSKALSQRDRLDPDLDPRSGVPIGQQSPDRARRVPNLDPAAPKAPLPCASQDATAQRWNLESRCGIEQVTDRGAVLVVDFNDNLGRRGYVDIAERQLHRPPGPHHVVGEVERGRGPLHHGEPQQHRKQRQVEFLHENPGFTGKRS